MIPQLVVPDVHQQCIPRESGDDPIFEYGVLTNMVYSPRERG